MNKQDLVAKIAQDTGATKISAAAAVDSLLDGITRALKKGRRDHLRRIRHLQDDPAPRPRGAEPAHRRRHQDSQAPRCPLYRRQSAQERRPLTQSVIIFRSGTPMEARSSEVRAPA